VTIDAGWLREHRGRVGDQVLLRVLDHAIGPESANVVMAAIGDAGGTEDAGWRDDARPVDRVACVTMAVSRVEPQQPGASCP